MKSMIFVFILALTLLGSTIQEANACQYCELCPANVCDGWICTKCNNNFSRIHPGAIVGVPKACQANCANKKGTKQVEQCLNKVCSK